jgi:hypothetical protein
VNKIYVLLCESGDYYASPEFVGAFSTREQAEAVKAMRNVERNGATDTIEEAELDSIMPHPQGWHAYHARISNHFGQQDGAVRNRAATPTSPAELRDTCQPDRDGCGFELWAESQEAAAYKARAWYQQLAAAGTVPKFGRYT